KYQDAEVLEIPETHIFGQTSGNQRQDPQLTLPYQKAILNSSGGPRNSVLMGHMPDHD
ncbi:hypothetical protein HispidOSU_025715, partial [Sigmodon hispidus]